MGYRYMDSFKLRREYLEEYLDEIRSAVTGRCTPIKPLITDENGCFSDEKIDSLIYSIVEVYLCRKREDLRYLKLTDSKYDQLLKLNNFKQNMYYNYFYCAFQGIIDAGAMEKDSFRTVETFDDIIELFTIPRKYGLITDERKLYISDLSSKGSWRGFFDATRFGCSMLMKKHFATTYTPEQVDFCHTNLKYSDTLYRLDSSYNKMMHDVHSYSDAMTWAKTITDPDKFVKCYISFREEYLSFLKESNAEHVVIEIKRDICEMIDYYLYRQGLSAFSSTEETAVDFDRLERLINTLKKRRNK